jgi:hypothetical protein
MEMWPLGRDHVLVYMPHRHKFQPGKKFRHFILREIEEICC